MNNSMSLEKKLIVYRHYIARYILKNKNMDLNSFYEARNILLIIDNLSKKNKPNDNFNYNDDMEKIKKYVVKTKKVEY